MIKGIVSALDMLLFSLSKMTMKNLSDYSYLATACSENTIVARDGSMMSVFEVYGAKEIVGEKELEYIVETFSRILNPVLKTEGHQLQFSFIRDQSRTESDLQRRVAPYWRAAKQKGLNLDDYFKGKIEHLKKFCAYESCYMVAWSRPSLIKSEFKKQQEENKKASKNMPPALSAQDVFYTFDALENKHDAFVDQLKNAFREAGLNGSLLKVDEALREIRKAINNDLTSDNWSPLLPNSKIPMTDAKEVYKPENDIGDMLWPSLSKQIFPCDIDIEKSDTIKVGDKYVASLFMELPPQKNFVFTKLLDQIEKQMPIQISFMMEGGGINRMALKSLAAALCTFTNSKNKLIKDSINDLRQREMEGETMVRMAVTAVTWSYDANTIDLYKQTVAKSMQIWGTSDTIPCNSDPVEGFLSTVPGLMPRLPSTPFVAPVEEVIDILPLTRQSHVWDTGSLLYRTEDGKIFPYQPGSSMQSTWNYIIFAMPGSGKSVLMNAENLAAVLNPGQDIPYIGIIDVGPSSQGLIQLLKDSAPENMKHLFLYEKLRNTQDYAINVLDTQLGFRFPTPQERAFSINFLTAVLTPVGADKPYPSTDKMVGAVIDEAYRLYSDTDDGIKKKKYDRSVSKEVDRKLDELKIVAKGKSWWWIVDELFKNGAYHEATLAQRFAVPIISDLASVAQESIGIKDLYQSVVIDTSENLLVYFNRTISETLSAYRLLGTYTKFDLGDSRVVSLDLDEVGKGGDHSQNHMAAIMYMLARYVVGKNFKIDKSEFVKSSPALYKEYHRKRAERISQTQKRICIDEFHNTAGIYSVRNQVVTDMREGRKWNLQVILASQSANDFTASADKDKENKGSIVEFTTGKYIMSGGDNYKKLQKDFDFNDSTASYIRSRLNGPTPAGAPFVFSVNTTGGKFSQFLYNTISPIEMWSFTTTAEDANLKRRLEEEIGPRQARRLLAKEYPDGVKKVIERISKDPLQSEEVLKDPYLYLVNKILSKHNKQDLLDDE